MTEYSDADLISAHFTLKAQIEETQTRHKGELAPLSDAVTAIAAELQARLDARGAKNTSVDGVGTAYKSTTLNVKVDNAAAFLAWIGEAPQERNAFLNVGVVKDPVKEWFAALDANGQPVNTAFPPGLTGDWFTKLNIRRT